MGREEGTIDPRYEFCAPRYHDFRTEETEAGANSLQEKCKREELEAEEWFSKLNAGLIDTDLTSPRSRACTYASSSPSKEEWKETEAKAKAKGEGLGAIFNALGPEEEESVFEETEVENGKAPEIASAEEKSRANCLASTSAARVAVATAPCTKSRGLGAQPRKTAATNAGLHITVPQSPMLSTKTRASKRLLTRQRVKTSATSRLCGMRVKKAGVRKRTTASKLLSNTSKASVSSPAFHTRSRTKSMGAAAGLCWPKGKPTEAGEKMATLRVQRKKIAKAKAKRRHTTSFEPFKLQTETRGMKKKRELLKIIEGEEMELKQRQSSFRARNVPNPFDNLRPSTRASKAKSPTEPKPFNLRAVHLHEKAQKNIEKTRIEKENMEKRMSTQFKARPSLCTTTRRQPFKPVKVNQQKRSGVIIPVPLKLKSASRAAERKNWNDQQRLRRLKVEEKGREEEEERKKAELMEIRNLRKNMEFKARPLPRYLR
ncbi:TPX2 domain-containing protein [Chloropicon primus]|nr:TPX2 domain-containing protein [Chloropicon primus]